MKKVRLLLFFVLISTIGIAQEFSPVGATWYYGFSAPSDPIAGVPFITDSKVRFVSGGYHFWPSTTNWSSTNATALNNVLFNTDPNYHNYLNIHVTGGTYSAAGYAITPSLTNLNFDSYLMTFNNEATPAGDYGWAVHLVHELGHCLDLLHTYDGNQNGIWNGTPTDACCPEVCDAGNFEYLDDIFSTTNWCGTTCSVCYQQNGWTCDPTLPPPTNRCTNNLMAGTSGAGYLSPKQMGKIHRALSLKSVRKYVRNCSYTTTENIEITSNETWDFNIKTYSDIIVKNGGTLTITCEVHMPDDSKIIVERGGKLIIDGGTVTSGCGGMWQGIEVWGTANASQYTTGMQYNYAAQGYLEIKNEAIIEHAKEAIRTVKVNSNGTLDDTYTGGIVIATNSLFRNNRRCAEFRKYDNMYLGSEYNNVSVFRACTLETTAALKVPTLVPSAFISFWDIKGVEVRDNIFRCLSTSGYTGTNRGKGVVSLDANFSIDKTTTGPGNKFENLDIAIEQGSGGTVTGTNYIKNNEFDENRYGVYSSGTGTQPYVKDNHFDRTGPAVLSPATFGFFSIGVQGISVACNYFYDFTYGNLVYNTGTSTAPASNINNNWFFDNYRTIQTETNNSKLKLTYNDFDPFASTQMHWYNTGPMSAQGAAGSPAANRFLGTPPASGDIWNTSSANMFIYYYNVPGDPNTYPTLNPAGNVLLLNTGITWTSSNWCTSGGGGGSLMAGGGREEIFIKRWF